MVHTFAEISSSSDTRSYDVCTRFNIAALMCFLFGVAP